MTTEPKFKEELGKMEYEPLLPVEKKLIIWSLVVEIIFFNKKGVTLD